MQHIVSMQLEKVAARLADRDISLSWDGSIEKHLAEEGYDPAFGARPLKRFIQKEVVDKVALAVLEGKVPPKSKLKLSLKGEVVDWKVT